MAGRDVARTKIDFQNKGSFGEWLKRNNCPEELRSRILAGEFRAATMRYASRTAPRANSHPTHTAEDEALLRQAAQLTRKIRDDEIDAENRRRASLIEEQIRNDDFYLEDDEEIDPDDPEIAEVLAQVLEFGERALGYDKQHVFLLDPNGEVHRMKYARTSAGVFIDRASRQRLAPSEVSSQRAFTLRRLSELRAEQDTIRAWRGRRGF